MSVERKAQVEILPDLGALSDEELKQLKLDLEAREHEVSYQRRVLHGQIDILRAEIVARLQRTGGQSVLDELDVDRLSEILSGKASPSE
jgi:RsiG-like